jgi:hypothetical protein
MVNLLIVVGVRIGPYVSCRIPGEERIIVVGVRIGSYAFYLARQSVLPVAF